jgi:hypothetical protein
MITKEDAQKMVDDLTKKMVDLAQQLKTASELVKASFYEDVVVHGSKADLGQKPLQDGWQDLPPTENQVKTICEFGVQPLQGLTRGKAACLIATLIEHPPADKRVIKK